MARLFARLGPALAPRARCPGESSLALLLSGGLSPAAAAPVREHLEICNRCAGARDLLLQAGALSTFSQGPAAGSPAVAEPRSPTHRAPPTVDPPAPGPSIPRAGLIVGGRYRLERCLGEGGMGTVWEAVHLITRERFALKLVRPQHSHKPAVRRRMLREARAAASVRHPHAVRIVDVFEAEGGCPVLVMDLLEGETLRQRLRRGKLPLGELAQLMVPAMAAVQSAHDAGVIHRDLKPDNLFLVARPGGGQEMRVLDFGLARLVAAESGSQLTGGGELLGTPCYMSPEQAFGEPQVDQRTDVWALGVILFECLAGRRPFEGDRFGPLLKRITLGERAKVSEAVPGVPDDVASLIDGMLSVAPAHRPANLHQAIAVLSRHAGGVVAGYSLPARPVARRALAAAVLAGLAVTAVAVAVGRSQAPGKDRPPVAIHEPGPEPLHLDALTRSASIASGAAPVVRRMPSARARTGGDDPSARKRVRTRDPSVSRRWGPTVPTGTDPVPPRPAPTAPRLPRVDDL